MATWHGVIAGSMAEAAEQLQALAERFKSGELDAWETRADLAKILMVLDDSDRSLARLSEGAPEVAHRPHAD